MQSSVGNHSNQTSSVSANQSSPTHHHQHQQHQLQPSAKNQSNSNNNINHHHSSSSNSHGGHRLQQINVDVPVRILVPSESVGAIIGKGGQTIRQLTQQSRAKVDVYRGEMMTPSNALQEKVITIRGQPDNCINACREILKVMKADSESKGKNNDMPLKVLAHNDYIGRIIGKQGDIINSIKRDTDTTVTVSSVNDMSMNVERVITVKGELENMINALGIIHAKIRSAFENDSKTYGHQAMVMSTIPQMPMITSPYVQAGPYNGASSSNNPYHKAQQAHSNYSSSQAAAQLLGSSVNNPANQSIITGGVATSSSNFAGFYQSPLINHLSAISASHSHAPPHGYHPNIPSGPNAASLYGHAAGPAGSGHMVASYNPSHGHAHGYMPPQLGHQSINEYASAVSSNVNGYGEPEKVFLYIPNTAVGAIIGSKGSYIKNLIKLSGASIKIAPVSAEESKTVSERQVIIAGLPDSQCKAQFYIYEKIRQERFTTDENVKLRAEIQVPANKIGRIIGRAGKNVREIQRSTGAIIKLPDESAQAQQKKQKLKQDPSSSASNDQETKQAEEATSDDKTENKEQEGASVEVEIVTSEKPEANAEDATTPASSEFVTVGIIGTFNASQLAQRRIQALINSTNARIEANQMAPLAAGQSDGKGNFYPHQKSNGFNGRKSGQRGGHYNHYNQVSKSHPPSHSNRQASKEASVKADADGVAQAPPPSQSSLPESKQEQEQSVTA